jgi:hypothetical protein
MAASDTVSGTTIAKLDQVILSLIEERERLLALGRAPAVENEDVPNPPAPLSRALPTPVIERVTAFEPLGRGFKIGFDKESGAIVTARQKPKNDPFVSPPDHHFTFEVEVVDPGTAKWITLEWQIGRVTAIEPSLLTVGLKAVASRQERMRLELSLPRAGAPQKRIGLGTLQVNTAFDFVSLSKRITREDLDDVDPAQMATVLMFLPVASFRIELAFLRAFLSPSGA